MTANAPITESAAYTLLERLIDYAGLFPPASLSMGATIRNYDNYLRSDDAWMLGRLIIPAARLDEFERELAAVSGGAGQREREPWEIIALTAPAGSAELAAHLERIVQFNNDAAQHDLAPIEIIELKTESAAAIDAALDAIPDDCFPFFELPIERDPRGLIAALAEAEAGAKVRCGGVTADAYPRPEHLARFLGACAAARVPFKATAGLHQPLRHYSSAVQAEEFGFLNVFAAGCLAWAGALDARELEELLVESDPSAIELAQRGLAWRGHALDAAAVSEARADFAVSFGSCSFDEPRAALRALRVLPLQFPHHAGARPDAST